LKALKCFGNTIHITAGKIQSGGGRGKKIIADYILVHKGIMTREARVKAAEATIFALLNYKQKEFIAFVLSKYVDTGVDELDQEKLPILLTNKYLSLEDAKVILGDVANISKLFIEFQEHLYNQKVA
jgi:hypothetical protein